METGRLEEAGAPWFTQRPLEAEQAPLTPRASHRANLGRGAELRDPEAQTERLRCPGGALLAMATSGRLDELCQLGNERVGRGVFLRIEIQT